MQLYLGRTRLIDRVSNAQIKYILMNGHFSGGKCSRRSEARSVLCNIHRKGSNVQARLLFCACRRLCRRRRGRRKGYSIWKSIYIEMIYYIYFIWRISLCGGDRKANEKRPTKRISYNIIL